MRPSWLRETAESYYFWPGLALAALAIGMALWGLTLWRQDWAGQIMWSALFGLAGCVLLALAFAESRHPHRRPTR